MAFSTELSSRPRTQSYGHEIARDRGPLICWIGLSRKQNWAVDGPCSKQLSQVPGGSQRRLWRHTSSLARGSSVVSASARPRVGAPARCFAMRCARCTLLLACTARCQPAQSSSSKPLRSGAVFCLLAPCSSAPSLFHGLHSFLSTTIIVHAPFVLATRHFESFFTVYSRPLLCRLGCHPVTVCISYTRLSRV